MDLIKKILVSIALINIAIGPAIGANLNEAEKAEASKYKAFLEPQGYDVRISEQDKKVLVYEKSSKQLVLDLPFGEQGQLQKYSPKALNKKLLDEMMKVKSAGKAALSHSISSLPSESLIFFMAMGAVVAGQLITDYSQNPIAMKQHIDHQMSPIGVFGFFTFMAAQGVTSNVLSLYFTNPKFQMMIPYLGMSVGAFVQSYLSQVVADPNVKACGREMLGYPPVGSAQQQGVDQDPCSKAYEYLVLKKKIWEFAPGIVSMLASSALAGAAQATVAKVVTRITGVDVGMWLVPGGMQLKGVRLILVKGLQIATFVSIDAWLSRKVNYAWKNFFDGNDFNVLNQKISGDVGQLKNTQWSSSNQNLKEDLAHFRTKMSDWRLMNLADIYEAHQAWSESLSQLTSMYNSSYAFYSSFVNEVRNVKFDEQPLKPLMNSYPLNGVTAKNLQEDRGDLYFQSPKMVENWQADNVVDVVAQIDQFLASKAFKELYSNERARVTAIRKLLASEDRLKIAEGLILLNDSIKENEEGIFGTGIYKDNLVQFRRKLGKPFPMLEPGRGFLSTYELAPTTAETVRATPFYRQVGNIHTPTITEHLLMQMICGPDVEKGGKIINTSLGYPSVFTPPQIKTSQDNFNEICQAVGRPRYSNINIYNWAIKPADGKQYRGFLSYLTGNVRPSVTGQENESAFPQWWTRTTETQMKAAFDNFSKAYEGIVIKMVKQIYNQDRESYSNIFSKVLGEIEVRAKSMLDKELWGQQYTSGARADKSTFNRGPISNSAMNSATQEKRLYLAILEELMNPESSHVLDLSKIMNSQIKETAILNLEAEFLKLNELIRSIRVVQVGGREVIDSKLENYQLEEQQQKIQNAINALSETLGVSENQNPGIQNRVNLNKSQKEIAVLCLQNLQTLSAELAMYGTMANAVSWDKIRNLQQVDIEKNKFNNSIQKKLAGMRGLL